MRCTLLGTRLRHLFATILFHCKPTSPEVLWMEFRSGICDDLRHRLMLMGFSNPSDEDIHDYGLFLLDKALRPFGSSLEQFETMPRPLRNWAIEAENEYIAEQLNYDVREEQALAEQQIALLNDEQRQAFDQVVDSTLHGRGRLFFLNGPGGTGKTFVYNTICHKVCSKWLTSNNYQLMLFCPRFVVKAS